jgi:hypothetical protein
MQHADSEYGSKPAIARLHVRVRALDDRPTVAVPVAGGELRRR